MTSKGSDQTARMRRLILSFAGGTYDIVGNLIPRLISFDITHLSIYWRGVSELRVSHHTATLLDGFV